MRIRPYQNKDFNTISPWITEERSHALWCANLIPYPLEKKGFDDLLQEAEERDLVIVPLLQLRMMDSWLVFSAFQ